MIDQKLEVSFDVQSPNFLHSDMSQHRFFYRVVVGQEEVDMVWQPTYLGQNFFFAYF